MDKVRLGMVGSRFAARTHLANNFAKLRGFKMEVVGIASKTEASAQQAAREFNIPSVYTDYRKLLGEEGRGCHRYLFSHKPPRGNDHRSGRGRQAYHL